MSPMTTLNFLIKPYSLWFIVSIVPYIVLIIDYDKKKYDRCTHNKVATINYAINIQSGPPKSKKKGIDTDRN